MFVITFVSGLIPSIVLASFNLTLPVLFEELANIEEWHTPLRTIQYTVLR